MAQKTKEQKQKQQEQDWMNEALVRTLNIRGAKGQDYWASFGSWYLCLDKEERLEVLVELDYKSNDNGFTKNERFMFRELYVICSKCELKINTLSFNERLIRDNYKRNNNKK